MSYSPISFIETIEGTKFRRRSARNFHERIEGLRILPVDEHIRIGMVENMPSDELLAEIAAKKARLTAMVRQKLREGDDKKHDVNAANETEQSLREPASDWPQGPYSAFTIGHSWPGMTVPLRQIGAIASGIAASVLATSAITTASRLAGFELSALSLWTVIPIAMLLTGLATALGCFFGCRLFRCTATWLLLIQMAVVAEFYPVAIYYFQHQVYVLDSQFNSPNTVRSRHDSMSR
ncbi:MAG: hypothetical protein ACXWJW_00790 [Xanthobacteraceae bacterium]